MDNMIEIKKVREMLKEAYLEVGSNAQGAVTIKDCASLTASRFREAMIQKLNDYEKEEDRER